MVDPVAAVIHEAFKRTTNGCGVACIYSPVSEGIVLKTGHMDPESIP